MTVIALVVVLGVLIFVHELGHFAAAKMVGIEVQRFSIGLGPVVAGIKRGETEYVLSAIPLGGYVKMGGMDDEVMERIEGGPVAEGEVGEAPPRREPSERDFDAKPIWARTFVISAGVIMNMLFALVTFTYLAVRYGVQEVDTTRVGQVEASLLPPGAEALADVASGSRVVSIGGEPVDNWGDLRNRLMESEPGPLSLELVEPRAVVQIEVPVVDEERFRLASAVLPWYESGIGRVVSGGPAERGGLEAGDRVLSVDGAPTENWWTFVELLQSRPGERVELEIERGGRTLVRAVTLDAEEVEQEDGSTLVVGRAGIERPGLPVTYREVSGREALATGWAETVAWTVEITTFLRDFVTLRVPPTSVGSIVTIGQVSGQAAAAGLDAFLRFMAVFSINLAVLNILPIPVLDGGHLVFLAIEAIRGGRALSVEQRLRWSNVGLIIIVGLMVLALTNDFRRLFGFL